MDNDTHYERDYRTELTDELFPPEQEKFWDAVGTVLEDISRFDDEAIKIIDPIVKAKFELLLKWSEKMAKEYYGRVIGDIKYEVNRAEIVLELPFFDFSTDEEHAFFMTAMQDTDSISIEPTKDSTFRLRMWFKYLKPIHTEEEREEFLRETAEHFRHKLED